MIRRFTGNKATVPDGSVIIYYDIFKLFVLIYEDSKLLAALRTLDTNANDVQLLLDFAILSNTEYHFPCCSSPLPLLLLLFSSLLLALLLRIIVIIAMDMARGMMLLRATPADKAADHNATVPTRQLVLAVSIAA